MYRNGHKGVILSNPDGCWKGMSDCKECYFSHVGDDGFWHGPQRCFDTECLVWKCDVDCPAEHDVENRFPLHLDAKSFAKVVKWLSGKDVYDVEVRS